MNVDGIKALVKLQAEADRLQGKIQTERTIRNEIDMLNRINNESENKINSFSFADRIFKRKEYITVKNIDAAVKKLLKI